MREFAFTVEYEKGVDEFMDLFIENSDLHSQTIAIHATTESMWRLDRMSGPPDVLEEFDDRLSNGSICNEIIGMCGSPTIESTHEILARTPDSRIVYACRKEGDGVRSIPYVAAKHIGDGLLMQAERRGHQYQWRLLIDDEETVGAIYEELDDELQDGLSLSVQRLSDPECWVNTGIGIDEDGLPPEQQAALEAAVEYGYYQMPREHTVQEISEKLGVPNSTLQYRLTRAEAWLARHFVSDALSPEGQQTETVNTELEV